jgi:hypothetical protein
MLERTGLLKHGGFSAYSMQSSMEHGKRVTKVTIVK